MPQTPERIAVPCPVCGSPVSTDEPKCPSCGTDYSLASIGSGESPTLVRLRATEPLDTQMLVDDLVETLSPRFQGLRRLGQGGMGLVYVARDPILKRDVAIKVLAPEFREDVGARERFLREAQAAAAVAHPNVVNIFAVGELKTTRIPYFIMQFIEGNTVEQAYPHGTATPEPVARRIIAEVAAALAAAHARELVHRDVKPSNVILDQSTGRAIVLDFGISASVQQHKQVDERLTATGVYIGTPRYMSPEQAGGDTVSDKSDMYSLGCVGYELLAGRPVFEAKSVLALFAAHLRDTPRPLAELRPGMDRELSALVERCLEKDPAKRPTADEVSRRLAPGGAVLLEWPPPGLEWLHRKLGGVSRAYLAGSALVLATMLPLIFLGARLPSFADSTATLLLLVPGALGFAVLGVATWRTAKLGWAATEAVRHGYAWLTVAETIADPDGESGALITGSKRFAAIAGPSRSELRRARLVRAGAMLIAGATPVPVLVAVMALASVVRLDHTLAFGVLLIPAACGFIAARAAATERRLAPPVRSVRQGTQPVETTRFSTTWYESFEKARVGQSMGPGSREHARLGSAAAVFAAALTLIIAGALVPVTLVGLVGDTVLQQSWQSFANTAEKAQLAEITRPWALPKDPRISAIDAGLALYALQPSSADLGVLVAGPRPPRPPAPWASAGPAPGLFPTATPGDNWVGPSPLTILDAAARGFSPAEMAYLEQVAKSPLWRDWDVVARAATADILGARFVLPFPKSANSLDIPVSRHAAIKQVAYASASRAAYHMARKQSDSAENALRTTISAGFVMQDNATTLLDELIGIVIVGIGRSELIQYFTLTGNPAGPRLKARFDSALVARETRLQANDLLSAGAPTPAVTATAMRASALRVATQPKAHRAVRAEMLAYLGVAPCTNVRELVFGPDQEIRDAFALARKEIVRFPADAAMLDLLEDGATRGTSVQGHRSALVRLTLGWAWAAGMILHNPRLSGCMQVLLKWHGIM